MIFTVAVHSEEYAVKYIAKFILSYRFVKCDTYTGSMFKNVQV